MSELLLWVLGIPAPRGPTSSGSGADDTGLWQFLQPPWAPAPPYILPITKPPFRWTTHEGPGSLPSLWT